MCSAREVELDCVLQGMARLVREHASAGGVVALPPGFAAEPGHAADGTPTMRVVRAPLPPPPSESTVEQTHDEEGVGQQQEEEEADADAAVVAALAAAPLTPARVASLTPARVGSGSGVPARVGGGNGSGSIAPPRRALLASPQPSPPAAAAAATPPVSSATPADGGRDASDDSEDEGNDDEGGVDPVAASLARGFHPAKSPAAARSGGSSESAVAAATGSRGGCLGVLDQLAVRSAVFSARKARLASAGGYAAAFSARKAAAAAVSASSESPPTTDDAPLPMAVDLAAALDAATASDSGTAAKASSPSSSSPTDALSRLEAALAGVAASSASQLHPGGVSGCGQSPAPGAAGASPRSPAHDDDYGADTPSPSGDAGGGGDDGDGEEEAEEEAVLRGSAVVLQTVPTRASTAKTLGVSTYLTPVRRSLRAYRKTLLSEALANAAAVAATASCAQPSDASASIIAALHPAAGAVAGAGGCSSARRAGVTGTATTTVAVDRRVKKSVKWAGGEGEREREVGQEEEQQLQLLRRRQATPYHARTTPTTGTTPVSPVAAAACSGTAAASVSAASTTPGPATPAGGSPGGAGFAPDDVVSTSSKPATAAAVASPPVHACLGLELEEAAGANVAEAQSLVVNRMELRSAGGGARGVRGRDVTPPPVPRGGGGAASSAAAHRLPGQAGSDGALSCIVTPGRRNALPLDLGRPDLLLQLVPRGGGGGAGGLGLGAASGDEPDAVAEGGLRHGHTSSHSGGGSGDGGSGRAGAALRAAQRLQSPHHHHTPVVASPGPFLGRLLGQAVQRAAVAGASAAAVVVVDSGGGGNARALAPAPPSGVVPHSAIERAVIPGHTLADTEDGVAWAPNPALPGVTLRAGHIHAAAVGGCGGGGGAWRRL